MCLLMVCQLFKRFCSKVTVVTAGNSLAPNCTCAGSFSQVPAQVRKITCAGKILPAQVTFSKNFRKKSAGTCAGACEHVYRRRKYLHRHLRRRYFWPVQAPAQVPVYRLCTGNTGNTGTCAGDFFTCAGTVSFFTCLVGAPMTSLNKIHFFDHTW